MKKIRNKISTYVGIVGVFIFPVLVSAQGTTYTGSSTGPTGWSTTKDIIDAVGTFINTSLMPVVILIAILYFLWNIVQYLSKLSNEKEREAFKKYSVNAILALFIMLSVWGIIAIGTTALFGKSPAIPQFRTNDQGNGGAPA
jgi:SNF family Na+-dependent transporter